MTDVYVKSQQQPAEMTEAELKYLNFVLVASLHTLVYFSNLYDYAKDKSGSFKPSVLTVEEKVLAIVGPVYNKFQGFPIEFLKFVDQKVEQSVSELDRCAPSTVKNLSAQAVSLAQQATHVARAMISGVLHSSVLDVASGLAKGAYTKCEPTAKDLYSRYEQVAEQYAVSAWRLLHRVPLFRQLAHVMVPMATFCSEKYNKTVQLSADKGYKVASYLPLVPIDKIAKVFGSVDAGEN